MTIFVGNREIKRIYVGGQGYIKKAYYGRKLVYEIQSLFESGVAGTYTLLVDSDGVYEIAICGAGGGGGGSATQHSWTGAAGGSGAAFLGNVALTRGTYTLMIGSGGDGGSASGANAPRGSAGTLSRIVDSSNNVLISAGAGNGGHGTGDYDSGGGQGGTLTMGTANVVSYEIQTDGVASSTVSILGNDYGAGGAARSRNSGLAGTNGYIRIKYVGNVPDSYTFTINPTPSDATVTLTVNGNTYTQNSITVFDGTTVDWSVSKSGYLTQTGSEEITEDITRNITLVENPVLYYCYYYSALDAYAYTTTDNFVNVYAVKAGNAFSFAKASSSQNLSLYPNSATNGSQSSITLGSWVFYRDSTGDLYT